jgi:NAD(P)-dependent dehydrogenase (short-subunit alcohol dehydrogenase family)
MTTFNASAVRAMTGKTVIVTGGASGLGLATARALASAGARTVLAVRDVGRGQAAARQLPGTVEVRALDLARLASVRAFARDWDGPVDLLVNNAAAVPPDERALTEDGFELQFGVDHLGHFALTGLLLGHITGRVVTVASQAERAGQLDLDDLAWQRRPYKSMRAYNTAKLANLLFTAELQRRLDAAGSGVLAMAAHPGFVATAIYRDSGPLARRLIRLVAQDADAGALPVLYAAVAGLPGDSFTGPRHLAHMRGGAELIGRSSRARDAALARRLWDASAELTGVDYPAMSSR